MHGIFLSVQLAVITFLLFNFRECVLHHVKTSQCFIMQVKDSVSSPGGTTITGLLCLEKGGVRGLMMEAVKAATDRAEQMKPKTQ